MKKLKILMICSTIVSILVSCTKGGDITTESAPDKSISGTSAAEESTNTDGINHMSIYLASGDNYMLSAVTEYNAKNQDIPIVVKEFDYKTQIEEIKEKLTMELMAGEGPDIIYTYSYLFPSLCKTISSGIFYDLNNLIEKDSQFKLSDYNQTILDSGIINGKRYLLPYRYYVPTLWTAKSILEQNNLKIDNSKWTWRDFFSQAQKYMDTHKGEEKYFTGFYFEPNDLMRAVCSELVDYKNKKTKFNTQEFIDLLKGYKAISQSICPPDQMVQDALYNYVKSDSVIIFTTGASATPRYTFDMNTVMQHTLGENVLILNFPSLHERGFRSVKVDSNVGINKNSPYKEKAFEFIKILLSEECQSNIYLSGIPVNMNTYRKELNNYSGEDVKLWSRVGSYYLPEPVNGFPVPPEVTKNVDEVINSNINSCNIIDYSIIEIATAEVDEYLKGSRSAEATAKAIDDKVMLYMNE